MYYQNYEDYMRTVLGYPTNNTFIGNDNLYNMDRVTTYDNRNNIEDMYPQLYKSINPIVCSVCDNFSGKLTEQILDNMVDEVYKKIELNNEIMVKINIENREVEKTEKSLKQATNTQNRTGEITANRVNSSEDRQIRRNPLLRDLIRILILNRILGGLIPERPPRPPFPGPRPPHGGPGGRPPFPPRPREYDNYTSF